MGKLQLKIKTETLIWSEMVSVPIAQSHSAILPRRARGKHAEGKGAGVAARREIGH